jgi:uncharacterized membrane protein
MLDAMRQPQTLHAMVVHFPIAVSVIGLILVFMLMLGGGKSHGMRWAIFVLYLIGAICAFFASQTGESAEEAMRLQMAEGTQLTEAASAVLEQHERMGSFVWIPLAVVSLASLLSVFKASSVRVMMLVVAVIGALFSAGWVAVAAHLGGQLVYTHGVGVPASQNNLVRPLPSQGDDDDAEPGDGDERGSDDDVDAVPPASPVPPKSEPKVETTNTTETPKPAAPEAVPAPEPVTPPTVPADPAPKRDDAAPAPAPPINDQPTADDVI